MFNLTIQLQKLGLIALCFIASSIAYGADDEFNTTKLLDNVPGESVANSAPIFMKQFQQYLLEYAQRAHHCSTPAVIETKIMHFSPIDTSKPIPILSGPIHEQWKILACGNKFYYYVGVAPDEQDETNLVFASVFKESDW